MGPREDAFFRRQLATLNAAMSAPLPLARVASLLSLPVRHPCGLAPLVGRCADVAPSACGKAPSQHVQRHRVESRTRTNRVFRSGHLEVIQHRGVRAQFRCVSGQDGDALIEIPCDNGRQVA